MKVLIETKTPIFLPFTCLVFLREICVDFIENVNSKTAVGDGS